MGPNLAKRINEIRLRDAMACIREVFERHVERGAALSPFVVLVGGTALAAHEIRDVSEDVDFFAPEFDADIVNEVEARLKERYGQLFKIDATSGENIWGDVLIRDISDSPTTSEISLGERKVVVKVLTPEDLYLLKLSAGREKDRQDLDLIVGHVDFETLLSRFEKYAKWHPDRHHIIGYVDRFVTDVGERFGQDQVAIIERLNVSRFVKEALLESRSYDNDI